MRKSVLYYISQMKYAPVVHRIRFQIPILAR